MEKTLFISHPSDLEFWNKDYSRIYYGNEFCQELTPRTIELQKILDFATKHNLNFTLVTCYCSDSGLKKIESLFQVLSHTKDNINNPYEIIFNDFGVFQLIRQYNFRPVLGRLLSRQKRDPRILWLMKKYPETLWAHLKVDGIINSYSAMFFKKEGIERVELDNLLQGITINNSNVINLKISLYFPFGCVTTGRLCLFKNSQRLADSCRRECQKYPTLKLSHGSMPRPLYLKGNTIFMHNDKIPELSSYKIIDRLVWQPHL